MQIAKLNWLCKLIALLKLDCALRHYSWATAYAKINSMILIQVPSQIIKCSKHYANALAYPLILATKFVNVWRKSSKNKKCTTGKSSIMYKFLNFHKKLHHVIKFLMVLELLIHIAQVMVTAILAKITLQVSKLHKQH